MIFDSKQTKELVLKEFLQICTFEGWSDESLQKAVKNCKIEEKFTNFIFENGCLEVADFYIDLKNEELAKKTGEIEGFLDKKIRDKIRLSLYIRFEIEDREILKRLMEFYSNPKNLINSKFGPRPAINLIKSYFKISDFIWKNINDSSTDFNFYTKRLTLAKIIKLTLNQFFKDETVELLETKKFIDLEIEKIMQFEKKKAKVKNIIKENFLDENSKLKSPKEILKNLPFFRLIKK